MRTRVCLSNEPGNELFFGVYRLGVRHDLYVVLHHMTKQRSSAIMSTTSMFALTSGSADCEPRRFRLPLMYGVQPPLSASCGRVRSRAL